MLRGCEEEIWFDASYEKGICINDMMFCTSANILTSHFIFNYV